MKKIIVIAVFLSLPGYTVANEWSTGDTVRETGFGLAIVLDWGTTISCQRAGWQEMNPILGAHPTDLEVSTYMLSAIVLHAGISYILPRPWREIWQYVSIGVEIEPIARNLGVHTGFKLLW